LIDKIGMHSMVIEADMAGNYVGSSYGSDTIGQNSDCCTCTKETGMEHSRGELGEICNPTATSEGAYGAQFWLNGKSRCAKGYVLL
jgi:hypothetical protein